MNYPFLLKFSSVTNLSDARYAAGMWADFIGFCFDPSSPDYIEPSKAKEIAGWINGPLIVGEFGHQPIEWIEDFVKGIPLHAIQVPIDYINNTINELGLPILLQTNTSKLTSLVHGAKCLITTDAVVAEQLKGLTELPVIFQIDITKTVNSVDQYSGIAFKGEQETAPGTRNQDEWTKLLEKYMD